MNRLFERIRRVAALHSQRLTESKPKHAKGADSPLLRTYFTGLLSLVLCTTMFLSTTYAWFSSDVTNTGNEIYIGSLDVGLYLQDGDALLDLSDSNHKLFTDQTLWEPGYTAAETIHIVNEGDLSFKYVFGFTDGALAEGSTLLLPDVAKCFDVWVYPHAEGVGPAATDYAAITAADSGWTHAGTLDTLLAGKTALEGLLHTAVAVQQPAGTAAFTVALHMAEDADPAVMGQRLNLSVKLMAYQLTAEVGNPAAPPPADDVTAD